MEWLATLFLGMFLFGLLFSVGSLLLGLGHDLHLPVGIHGHIEAPSHGGPGHLPAQVPDSGHVPHLGHEPAPELGAEQGGSHTASISPWNLTAITAFLAWFGGAGYLALTQWQLGVWLALLLAGLVGLIGWAIVFQFYRRVLLQRELSMDPSAYRLEGTVARVTMPISDERIGEIQFVLGGVRRSEGARSSNGQPIGRGVEVVIVRYERGLAYVEPWSSYVEGETLAER